MPKTVSKIALSVLALFVSYACSPDPDSSNLTDKQKEEIILKVLTKESAFLKLVVADLKVELANDPTNPILTEIDNAANVLPKVTNVYLAQAYMNEHMLKAEKAFFGPKLDWTDVDDKFRTALEKVLLQDKFKYKDTDDEFEYREFLWMTFQRACENISTKTGEVMIYYSYLPNQMIYDDFKLFNPLISVNILRMMSMDPDSRARDLLVIYLHSVYDIESRKGPNIKGLYYDDYIEKTKYATVFLFNRIALFGYNTESTETLEDLGRVTSSVSSTAYKMGNAFGIFEHIRGENPISMGIGTTIYALCDKMIKSDVPSGFSETEKTNFSEFQKKAKETKATWSSMIGSEIITNMQYEDIEKPFLMTAVQVLVFSAFDGVSDPVQEVRPGISKVTLVERSIGEAGTVDDAEGANVTKQLASKMFRASEIETPVIEESGSIFGSSTEAPISPINGKPTGTGTLTLVQEKVGTTVKLYETPANTDILNAPSTVSSQMPTNVVTTDPTVMPRSISSNPGTIVDGLNPIPFLSPNLTVEETTDNDNITPVTTPEESIVIDGEKYVKSKTHLGHWVKANDPWGKLYDIRFTKDWKPVAIEYTPVPGDYTPKGNAGFNTTNNADGDNNVENTSTSPGNNPVTPTGTTSKGGPQENERSSSGLTGSSLSIEESFAKTLNDKQKVIFEERIIAKNPKTTKQLATELNTPLTTINRWEKKIIQEYDNYQKTGEVTNKYLLISSETVNDFSLYCLKTPAERYILAFRIANNNPETLEQIAEKFNKSLTVIARTEKNVIKKLDEYLKDPVTSVENEKAGNYSNNVPDLPKKVINEYVQENEIENQTLYGHTRKTGFKIPGFYSLQESLLLDRPFIIRTEHPRELDRGSGIRESYVVDANKIKTVNTTLDEIKDNSNLTAEEIIAAAVSDYRRGKDIDQPLFESLLKKAELENNQVLKFYLGFLKIDAAAYMEEASYSYNEYIAGSNGTIVMDSADPRFFYISLKRGQDMGHTILMKGEAVRGELTGKGIEPLRPEVVKQMPDYKTLSNLVNFYKRITNLPKLRSDNVAIIEYQLTDDNQIYFLQYHIAAKVEEPTFKLTRELEADEIESIYVRGVTPPEGIIVTTYFAPNTELLTNPNNELLGFTPSWPIKEDENIAFNEAIVRKTSVYFLDPINLNEVATGHIGMSIFLKPKVSVVVDFSDPLMEKIGVTRGQVNNQLKVKFRVISDGKTAYIKFIEKVESKGTTSLVSETKQPVSTKATIVDESPTQKLDIQKYYINGEQTLLKSGVTEFTKIPSTKPTPVYKADKSFLSRMKKLKERLKDKEGIIKYFIEKDGTLYFFPYDGDTHQVVYARRGIQEVIDAGWLGKMDTETGYTEAGIEVKNRNSNFKSKGYIIDYIKKIDPDFFDPGTH